METTAPIESISRLDVHGEIHFAVGGFWKLEEIQPFLERLNEASMPFVKARQPIRVMGDMSQFMPQNRETGAAIRDHLMMAQKFGLERVAIVSPPPLVKMQYRRLSQGIEVEYFEGKVQALGWLRRAA